MNINICNVSHFSKKNKIFFKLITNDLNSDKNKNSNKIKIKEKKRHNNPSKNKKTKELIK